MKTRRNCGEAVRGTGARAAGTPPLDVGTGKVAGEGMRAGLGALPAPVPARGPCRGLAASASRGCLRPHPRPRVVYVRRCHRRGYHSTLHRYLTRKKRKTMVRQSLWFNIAFF